MCHMAHWNAIVLIHFDHRDWAKGLANMVVGIDVGL